MSSTELEVRPSNAVAVQDELTIEQLSGQVQKIQQAMAQVMKKGEHYGTIPGAGSKQILFKAGAEKLCLLFRLDPEYDVSETYHDDGHYTVRVSCGLHHITSGNRMGSGLGLCTSKERKYANVRGAPNPNLPDTYNTVLKMACKRALVAAVLNTTAASDIFTQDLEDAVEVAPVVAPTGPPVAPATLEELKTTLKLVDYAADLWGEEVMLANASRKFGRQINGLAGLTEDEAKKIITGAQHYFLNNPPVVAEEVVEEPKEPRGRKPAKPKAEPVAEVKEDFPPNVPEGLTTLMANLQGEAEVEVVEAELVDEGIDWPGEAPA